jgi:tetratricopeptide (TPR) repeat protein
VVVSSPAFGKRRRLPGLAVRPGSIRQARSEAGLSLGQVASGQISRTAIFLAETGKTRPTLPTIQLIAARTGKPVEYFLDGDGQGGTGSRPDLEKLRELAVQERFGELRDAAEAARELAIDPLDRAWVGFYLGRALLQLANPYLAFPELRRAKAAFEAAGDPWMVVECMELESAGLHLLDDASAIHVAEAALEACRRLTPPNRALEARILSRIGSIHVAHHRWAKAVDYYSLAVEVAGEMKDLSRVGKMYNDLGIAYEHLGDLTRSRSYAQKAITIHELLHDRVSVARAENNLGLVLIRQGQTEKAREHLTRSLDICEEAGVEVGKAHVLLSLAELDLNDSDPDGARRRVREALEIAQKNGESATLADAHEILGRVADFMDQPRIADREFATAIALLDSSELSERLVSCRASYAKLLEKRGDTAGALEQLKRAMVAARPDLGSYSAKRSGVEAGSA